MMRRALAIAFTLSGCIPADGVAVGNTADATVPPSNDAQTSFCAGRGGALCEDFESNHTFTKQEEQGTVDVVSEGGTKHLASRVPASTATSADAYITLALPTALPSFTLTMRVRASGFGPGGTYAQLRLGNATRSIRLRTNGDFGEWADGGAVGTPASVPAPSIEWQAVRLEVGQGVALLTVGGAGAVSTPISGGWQTEAARVELGFDGVTTAKSASEVDIDDVLVETP